MAYPTAVRIFFLLLTLLAAASGRAEGASRAVIVVGLAAGEIPTERLHEQAAAAREGFIARGFSPTAIDVIAGGPFGPVRRESILAALEPAAPPAVETWILLLGTVAPGREGQPAFQVNGPRLTADDFAAALKALPGKKSVVIAAAGGGGFLPALLKMNDVEAVAATAASGEVNEPRFGGYWAEALVKNPHSRFTELAAAAAIRVEAFYKENKIGQSEHARMVDRSGGTARLVEAPFKTAAVEASASPAGGNEASRTPQSPAVSDIKIPKPADNLDIERREATDETRAMIAEARGMAVGSEHAALILVTELDLLVGGDFSTTETWRTRSYVRSADAIDELATLTLPSNPPHLLTSLSAARVIRPDGSQVVINPRPLVARAAANEPSSGDEAKRGGPAVGPPVVELPEVTAGCIVEASWTVERRSTGELPEFYNEWMFAEKFPQRVLRVNVMTPKDERWRVFSPTMPGKPVSTETDTRRTQRWTVSDVAAFEPLAGDAPARSHVPWLGVSSLPSWDAFAAWYGRLSAGSGEAGPEIVALAAEIGAAHNGRGARLKAAYERVAALRYVAIELGVGAFRPRTPAQVWRQHYGDCKDKANLLVAVIRQLGIAADFVLINRGNVTFTEFPGWQFNHAIVRVPAAPNDGQAGDLWLDGTDRLVPFGVIAPGDLGREALAFPLAGAPRFATVTAAQEPPSEWRENWKLNPGPAGIRFSGTVELTASGAADATLRRMFSSLTPAQRSVRLHDVLGVPSLTVESVRIGDVYDLNAEFFVEAKVSLNELPPAQPPGFATLFAPAKRERPVYLQEGRAWRYSQTLSGIGPAASKQRVQQKAGAVTLIVETASQVRTVEITGRAGALSPSDYSAARDAWLKFSETLSPSSP